MQGSIDLFHNVMGHEIRQMRLAAGRLQRRYSPEAVHDLRVSALKINFALKFFKLKTGARNLKAYQERLRTLRGVLGESRNLDILSSQGMGHLVLTKKKATHQKLRAILTDPSFGQLLKNFEGLKHHPQRIPGVSYLVKESLGQAVKSVKKYTQENLDPHCYHKMRIAFKKLRYACDFLEDVNKPLMKKSTAYIIPFQNILGKRQDALASLALLSTLKIKHVKPLIKVQKSHIESCQRKFEKLMAQAFRKKSDLVKLGHWLKRV